MSCAERKSSKLASTSATASRCRVGRRPAGGSVLVIVLPVRGVPVAVVHVVDVVAVPDRDVAAVRAVLVRVLLGVDVVERRYAGVGREGARSAAAGGAARRRSAR